MTNLTLSEKERIIAYFALRLLVAAIEQVSEHWTETDINIARNLLQKLKNERQRILNRRKAAQAENLSEP